MHGVRDGGRRRRGAARAGADAPARYADRRAGAAGHSGNAAAAVPADAACENHAVRETEPAGAGEEPRHCAVRGGAHDAVRLGGAQGLVVDGQQGERLDQLRLDGRCADHHQRLLGEHRRTLRNGVDIAGEAEVPFFSISGSEFVEMFVGMGAAKVRDLFKQANEKAPCIVFIDEIDTIGKKRDGAGFTGGNDEREQTLNQLLTEMDGFDGSKGVVILAATNRPDSLDPALLRPGRFDRRIPVELPDLKGREEILKVHAKKIKIADSVRFDEIAKAAAGASGAELANIVNEAALRAVRDGRKFATQADFEESIEVVIAGYQKKNRVLSNKEKLIVAYHEIGHALVAAKQTESAPVHKITIIPRTSGALGYTMQVDDGDHYLMTKEELANKIATFTGGRAAEELIFHSITTGASNDIEQATKLARAMISRYGMSEDFDMVAMENVTNQYLGGDSSLSCSFETQTLLDKKVVELVRMEHQKALKILQDNIGKLHELAKYLYEHETITGEEFMKILNAPVQVPTVVAESESNTESENNAESENSTEADADTSSGKVNLQK